MHDDLVGNRQYLMARCMLLQDLLHEHCTPRHDHSAMLLAQSSVTLDQPSQTSFVTHSGLSFKKSTSKKGFEGDLEAGQGLQAGALGAMPVTSIASSLPFTAINLVFKVHCTAYVH